MVQFCKQANITSIAEGIETEEELQALIRIGVDYGQGYYLGKPAPAFSALTPGKAEKIKASYQKSKFVNVTLSSTKIINLSIRKPTVNISDKAKAVCAEMSKNAKIEEFFVLNKEDIVQGILTKTLLSEKFSRQYGYGLNSRRTVKELMKNNPLCVDENLCIEQVAELAMNRPQECIYDAIAVTKSGHYIGTVTVKDILLATINLRVQEAKDAKTLTRLPGNKKI